VVAVGAAKGREGPLCVELGLMHRTNNEAAHRGGFLVWMRPFSRWSPRSPFADEESCTHVRVGAETANAANRDYEYRYIVSQYEESYLEADDYKRD
jgi:hypothetical protein